MKKLQTVLGAGMILLSVSVFGQTGGSVSQKKPVTRTTETHFDILLNVAMTNLNYGKSNSALADYKKPSAGLQAGFSFQAGITPGFSMVSELYYIKEGGSLNANNPITAGKTSFNIGALELPLLARFHFGRFYVNAGPSIAYNLSASVKTDGVSVSIPFKNSGQSFKRWDAGIQMGGGYEFQIKQKRVAVDVRYAYGLTNISYGQEMYTRSLVVSLRCVAPWKTNPLGKK